MYLFPKLDLPPKAIEAAQNAQQSPDTFYAMALLNATGLVSSFRKEKKKACRNGLM